MIVILLTFKLEVMTEFKDVKYETYKMILPQNEKPIIVKIRSSTKFVLPNLSAIIFVAQFLKFILIYSQMG